MLASYLYRAAATSPIILKVSIDIYIYADQRLVKGHFLGGHRFSKVTAQHRDCVVVLRVGKFPLTLTSPMEASQNVLRLMVATTININVLVNEHAFSKCERTWYMYEIINFYAATNFHCEIIFMLAIKPQILDTRIIYLILRMSAIGKFCFTKIQEKRYKICTVR